MRLNLKRLGLLAGKAARGFAKPAGLTPQRLDLLQIARSGPFSQRQIAERLCVARCVVSRMLKALEEDDLVFRDADPKDRRIKLTYVTRLGLQRLGRCCADEDARGAQATGESIWLRAWRYEIAQNGLRVDSVLRAKPPSDFEALALWNRRYVPRPVTEPAPEPPRADRELEAKLRAMGIDYKALLRGEWVRPNPPST